MLDFNNLNYFPSLFEDLSTPKDTYNIIKLDLTWYYNPKDFLELMIPTDKISNSKTLILDTGFNKADTYIQKTTTPVSLTGDSASSTFSKYFYFADPTVPSIAEDTPSPSKVISLLGEVTESLLPSSKKTVTFKEDTCLTMKDMVEPLIPEIKASIEPPFVEDGDFYSFSTKESRMYSQDLDPILPDVGERSRLSPPLLSDFETADYSLTHHHTPKKAIHKDNQLTPTLHKLNTDSIEASPKLHDLHEQLFEYKELFQDKNKQVSDLEIHNVELDFRIASIEKEIATLIKEKLELTKQFNINNIKGMDPLSFSLLDKYKEAYLSITHNNLSITSKVAEIKEKLTFLDNTKLDLLKDIHYNRKMIDKLNVDKAMITKSIHAIEKITGNITKTPLS